MSNVIDVEDLSRRYAGGFEAVREVSFSVRRGELFALLGTNGAGKTSTLEVLEGLAEPSGGRVRVLGFDPGRARASVRPRIGIMLQEGGFPGDLTVDETARMWAGTLTSSRPVGEALEMVELAHRSKVAVAQLSGGERRRLDLALAVLGRPEVLFLDEPTTGLDPESRQNTWRLVRRLLEGGTSVLLTTHYLDEAETLADRLAIMHEGRIVREGTVSEVVASQPATISFASGGSGGDPQLPPLDGARIVMSGGRTVIETEHLQQTLTRLLVWAEEHRVELPELAARPASLEQVFLAVAEHGDGSPPAGSGDAELRAETLTGAPGTSPGTGR
ncbi:ABC transporter ATP-binding protein [Phytoactinopolyspora halophila]|uniref:ABC transporter ATP-binding protein n=1 Tax=Phytoactinopolyspora halophila TaxID=1981511 RepID=UPI001B8CEF89|nr:ABC transporter ATP-binding protein [Phytoactinopolyspora halophila]